MDNLNTRINKIEEVWIKENIISSEPLTIEYDAIETQASVELEMTPKLEEMQENTPDHAASAGEVSNLKICKQCLIIIHGNYVLEKNENGEVDYFCSECLNLFFGRLVPSPISPRPIVQPPPSPSTSSISLTSPSPSSSLSLSPSRSLSPSPSPSSSTSLFSSTSSLTSTTIKITDPASLYMRICFSCYTFIETNDCNNVSWQARDYCNGQCVTSYQMRLISSYCMECKCSLSDIDNLGKYSLLFGTNIRVFCSKTCVDTYKNSTEMCQYCNNDNLADANTKYFAPVTDQSMTIKRFCSIDCVKNYYQFILNISAETEADSSAKCMVCKKIKCAEVKFQYNDNLTYTFCSEICFGKFQYRNKKDVLQCYICKVLYEKSIMYKYCLYDKSLKNFCSENCQTTYYITRRVIVECNSCKVRKYNFDMIRKTYPNNETIYACSCHCLKNINESPTPKDNRLKITVVEKDVGFGFHASGRL